ncbi:MAG TPA: efflux RND transporter periplasmic adaptor subunit [Anaeromyxobacteraceae bacterium]|nr:efflux RND transporter periplasmic adaptor subunit [Anaeromyxobacteraceae bacterium]
MHHDHDHEPMPEGEEHAPPGTHTAAIVRWALVALMALAAVGGWAVYTGAFQSGPSANAQVYQCPMHPSVIQDHPGDCPICGMDLVLVANPAAPGGGSAAPKATPAATASSDTGSGAPAGAGKYWCPMHPEVTSDDPNATCEKCGGMKLLPRPPDKGGEHAGHGDGAHGAHADGAHAGHGDAAQSGKAGTASATPGTVPGLTEVMISPERIQLMGMKTARAVRENLSPELRTVGFVSANEGSIAMIHTRFSGWIEDLRVAQTGQPVRRGEVVATVYSPDLLAAQQEYLNALRWQKGEARSADSERLTNSLATDARRRLELLGISEQEIAALAKSGKPLRAMSIRSPVAGFVTEKNALQGQFVGPDTTLFTIADLSTVWVVADVYEYEVARVRTGQTARLQLAAYPGEVFRGRVEFIYPTLDPQTRTLKVRIAFKNPGLKLRPGMFGDVFLDLGASQGVAVPADAVVNTGDAQYVFVVLGEGRFAPRPVQTGARGDGKIAILSGVQAGDEVVTTANFLVDSESRMRAAIEGFGGGAASSTTSAPQAQQHQH